MSDSVWVPLLLSLKVAGWATLLAAVAGTAAAYGLSRWRWRGRDLLDALLTLPLVLPPTVLGYLLVLLGRRGVLGETLAGWGIELVFTWQGRRHRRRRGGVSAGVQVGPRGVRERRRAAGERGAGAGRVRGGVFFRVTLPLAARGIVAGVLLAFARALGEFGATLMIAGNLPGRTQTLSVAIYEAVQAGDDATANLLVLVTSVTCVVVLLLAGRLVPVSGRRDSGAR